MIRINLLSLLFLLSIVSCSETKNNLNNEDIPFAFPIPQNENIQIDGDFEDWNADIFTEVNQFSNQDGDTFATEDFSCKAKIAWQKNGLLLMLDINDNKLLEDKDKGLLNGDCIELFFCNGRGNKNLSQFVIALGIDGTQTAPRIVYWDQRGSRKALQNEMEVSFKANIKENGYKVEFLLPFQQVGVIPELGNLASLHINVLDLDSVNKYPKNLQWHYLNNAYLNSYAAYNLILSEKEKKIIDYSVRSYTKDYNTLSAKIFTQNGGLITLKNNYKTLAKSEEGPIATFDIPMDTVSKEISEIEVYLDDELIDIINSEILLNKFIHTESYPHEQYVRTMMYRHKLTPPPDQGILFIGTSHIRFWGALQDDMPGLPAYNNGFGGSQTTHVLHYMDEIVIPFAPKTIVYLEGGNDVNAGRHAGEITENTEKFVNRVHEKLPNTEIIILTHPMKLRRDRKILDTVADLHQKIAEKYDFVYLLDLKDALTDENGVYYENVLLPDNVHMNPNGYKYFSKPIREYLNKKYN